MRAWPVFALLSLLLPPLEAQDVKALTGMFTRYFERAGDLESRAGIVRDAVASKVAGMGPFYQRVLEFAADHGAEVAGDSRLREMASLASARIAEEKHGEGRTAAWALFQATGDLDTRVAALKALEVTAAADKPLIAAMASRLEEQNRLLAGGGRPDPKLVLALVRTLGSIGDPVAFSPLFQAHVAGHSAEIAAAAGAAVLANRGDLRELLGAVIRSGSLRERHAAFALAAATPRIDQQGKAALAEDALRAALAAASADGQTIQISRELRASAVAVLESARWSRASAPAVEHFSTAALEYDRGQVSIAYVVAAANGLGAMGTHEAAERLAAYLEMLNARRELGRPYDEQIVLAVVVNLGRIGDKSAFAALSYARYLDYSEQVKRAVTDAISSLKW